MLVKVHDLNPLIKKEEISLMIKQVNQRYFNKIETNNMDFDGFLKFVPQMAALIYSRKPNDLRFAPAGVWLQTLFKTLEAATRKRGDMASLSVFEESEGSGKENELTVMLNTQLKAEPDKAIPEVFEEEELKKIEIGNFIKFHKKD